MGTLLCLLPQESWRRVFESWTTLTTPGSAISSIPTLETITMAQVSVTMFMIVCFARLSTSNLLHLIHACLSVYPATLTPDQGIR